MHQLMEISEGERDAREGRKKLVGRSLRSIPAECPFSDRSGNDQIPLRESRQLANTRSSRSVYTEFATNS
jgi:hypothetical protein